MFVTRWSKHCIENNTTPWKLLPALIRESCVCIGVVDFVFHCPVSDYNWTYSRKSMLVSCTFYFNLCFFFPLNNPLCKNLFGLHNWSLRLHKTLNWNLWWWTHVSVIQVEKNLMLEWSCVPVVAWPKTMPFELNCSLEPVGVSCVFCIVPFGVLCQALLIVACPEFLQHLLAEGWAGVAVAAPHSDLCGFRGCCRGGWLFCSPADIPWVCRSFQLERPASLSYSWYTFGV